MSMDEQIARAKEEASSRKEIMEKVERWMLARDEERWLEEYSMVFFLTTGLHDFFASILYYIHTNHVIYLMNIFRMKIDIQLAEVLIRI